ncbi:MAG: Potassium efflux system KefA protein / Small-conductance mechanosensitive channel, partial [uncultured Friedmanniella sp.]
ALLVPRHPRRGRRVRPAPDRVPGAGGRGRPGARAPADRPRRPAVRGPGARHPVQGGAGALRDPGRGARPARRPDRRPGQPGQEHRHVRRPAPDGADRADRAGLPDHHAGGRRVRGRGRRGVRDAEHHQGPDLGRLHAGRGPAGRRRLGRPGEGLGAGGGDRPARHLAPRRRRHRLVRPQRRGAPGRQLLPGRSRPAPGGRGARAGPRAL